MPRCNLMFEAARAALADKVCTEHCPHHLKYRVLLEKVPLQAS